MRVSIVIPVYNEEDNILPLAEEIAALAPRCPDLEALFVDDGSTDATWAHILEARGKHPHITALRHPQRQGQTAAVLNGLQQAGGEVLVTMDGDLQNDPADIPSLLAELENCDCVCGYRAHRQDSWSKRAASRLANRVRNWVTRDGILDTGCSLKAFRRHCLTDLPRLSGVHRFMPAYFKLHGRAVRQVPVNHRPRRHGRSKYTNLRRLPTTIADLFGFWWYRNRLLPNAPVETTAKG
ncbi:MAG: glycosyltransferase family 2 protein [Kiritimatiellae bacterium]|nr:glycosyltransferase family 2 protein [Kiritimatiellia bacterium]